MFWGSWDSRGDNGGKHKILYYAVLTRTAKTQ
jgi:hypothetical protein